MMKNASNFFVSSYKFHWPRVNSLLANFFQRNHKHVFTFYVIPPRWHAKDNWNPSPYKTRTYLFYIVNTMVADVLVTQGARASATMILTLLKWDNLVPTREELIQILVWYFADSYQWLFDCMSPCVVATCEGSFDRLHKWCSNSYLWHPCFLIWNFKHILIFLEIISLRWSGLQPTNIEYHKYLHYWPFINGIT